MRPFILGALAGILLAFSVAWFWSNLPNGDILTLQNAALIRSFYVDNGKVILLILSAAALIFMVGVTLGNWPVTAESGLIDTVLFIAFIIISLAIAGLVSAGVINALDVYSKGTVSVIIGLVIAIILVYIGAYLGDGISGAHGRKTVGMLSLTSIALAGILVWFVFRKQFEPVPLNQQITRLQQTVTAQSTGVSLIATDTPVVPTDTPVEDTPTATPTSRIILGTPTTKGSKTQTPTPTAPLRETPTTRVTTVISRTATEVAVLPVVNSTAIAAMTQLAILSSTATAIAPTLPTSTGSEIGSVVQTILSNKLLPGVAALFGIIGGVLGIYLKWMQIRRTRQRN